MASPENTQRAVSRFTLMIENSFTVDKDESIACVGVLHGTIHKGDVFLILHPMYPAGIRATADALVVDGDTKDEATDCRVAVMTTAVQDPEKIMKFSVITNIIPTIKPEQGKPAENPFVIGLSMEYNRFVKDNDFTYTFMVALLTANLLTPAQVGQPTVSEETGKTETKVSFKLIKHPNDENLLVLPLFTDMIALRLWQPLFEDKENPPTVLALPFQRSAEIGLANGGIVLNPFGPNAVFVSNPNIESTKRLGAAALKRHQEQQENNNGDK